VSNHEFVFAQSLYRPQFWDVHSCIVHGSRADFSRSGAVDSHFQENNWEELSLDGCTFFFSEAHSTDRIYKFFWRIIVVRPVQVHLWFNGARRRWGQSLVASVSRKMNLVLSNPFGARQTPRVRLPSVTLICLIGWGLVRSLP
jgi:hypothetical protein